MDTVLKIIVILFFTALFTTALFGLIIKKPFRKLPKPIEILATIICMAFLICGIIILSFILAFSG
jgi:hypothetical protein